LRTFLILEDYETEANQLKEIIGEISEPTEVYIASGLEEAEEIAEKKHIDVFLLDVNLPDGSGLSFAEKLRQTERYKYSWIIFITGFESYAYDATRRTHCYSYLMKPYDRKEILQTINEVFDKRVSTLRPDDFLRFKSGGISIRIPYSDVVYIESLNRKCYVHTINTRYETSRVSLKSFLEDKHEEQLVQCHRSYIVNREHIKKFDKKYRGSFLEMQFKDIVIPVGTNYIDIIQGIMA